MIEKNYQIEEIFNKNQIKHRALVGLLMLSAVVPDLKIIRIIDCCHSKSQSASLSHRKNGFLSRCFESDNQRAKKK